jgi:hypothetical protein
MEGNFWANQNSHRVVASIKKKKTKKKRKKKQKKKKLCDVWTSVGVIVLVVAAEEWLTVRRGHFVLL